MQKYRQYLKSKVGDLKALFILVGVKKKSQKKTKVISDQSI